ncbi:MAG: methyltransferase domain-containing protein [Planctomycetes bacterium]|nr:methyltransferase domain-containing protein [Planctomycetota bacterium]MCB9871548.1 methyltransferase domain-containing protein [Planctomycetota bacterium]
MSQHRANDGIPVYVQVDILDYDASAHRLELAGWGVTRRGAAERYEIVAPDGSRVKADSVPRPDLAQAHPAVDRIDQASFSIVGEGIDLAPGQVIETAIILMEGGVDVGMLPIGFRNSARRIPLPDPDFMRRVANSNSQKYFLASGNRHAQDVARMLRPHRDPREVTAFLDWGCGCGRVTRHLLEVFPNAKPHGTDIDYEAIEWLSGAIPEGEFHATGLLPPLPYPDASFDFVLASSVFTHLTAEVQDAWLRELHRVLRPGAILMATTHGEAAAEWVRDPAIDKALRKTGFFDSAPDEGLGHIASGDYYRATFQTADYTRTHWLEYFEELERRVAGLNFHQDVWMLRRR